jgi:acyl carrier protein
MGEDDAAVEEGHDEASEVVRRLLAERAPARGQVVRAESRLVEDLGFDSLRLMEVVLVVENELRLPPTEDEALVELLEPGSTVGDAQRVVRRLLVDVAGRVS